MPLKGGSVVAFLLLASPAAGQPVAGGPDFTVMRLGGGDLNRYEAMYGEPEFRTLDSPLDPPGDWPLRRSIRTEGEVYEFPVQDSEGNQRHGYGIRGEAHALAPVPVEELLDVWAAYLPFWVRQRVEIVGAFDPGTPGAQAATPAPSFLVWEIAVIPEKADRPRAPRASMEDLVIDPEAHVGQEVTVVGTFRGSNLFGDLDEASRREEEDWVLRDGHVFIWVTGRAPKGDGFYLDPGSRADCRHRLEVVGEVHTRDGFVYLKATEVRLLETAREVLPE